jgi:lipopolysaccharide export system permease protein
VLQAVPIASLLASVIAMVILSRGNEITVMRAAGMNPSVIAAPLVVGGLVLSFAAFAVGEFVIPQTSKKVHYIESVLIEKKADGGIDEGVRWVREKNKLFHFKSFDSSNATLKQVSLLYVDSQFRPIKSTHAASAKYSFEQGNWTLSDLKIFKFKRNGSLLSAIEQKSALAFLPIDPKKLRKERRLPDEMSISELGEKIKIGAGSGKDVLKEKIAWNLKLAYPFAALFVSLIGFKFAYRSERSSEAVRKILMAFLTGISYWFILSAARALGLRGDISPFFAAWAANLFMLSFTAFQFFQVRKA